MAILNVIILICAVVCFAITIRGYFHSRYLENIHAELSNVNSNSFLVNVAFKEALVRYHNNPTFEQALSVLEEFEVNGKTTPRAI